MITLWKLFVKEKREMRTVFAASVVCVKAPGRSELWSQTAGVIVHFWEDSSHSRIKLTRADASHLTSKRKEKGNVVVYNIVYIINNQIFYFFSHQYIFFVLSFVLGKHRSHSNY